MSKPSNILSKFRSYSYHHILMVCNSTDAAIALANTSEITTFQHPMTRDSSKYEKRQVGLNPDSYYITLIDTSTDYNYTITSASWENIMSMGNFTNDDGIPQSTSMALDGELEISEPAGAEFLNLMVQASKALQSDPVGLVFVLKTIFVGHRDGGGFQTIPSIRPFMFVPFDISAIFDSSGAKYKFSVVGVVNGASKLPQTQRVFSGLGFNIKPGQDIKTLMETTVTEKVNEAYANYKKEAVLALAQNIFELNLAKGRGRPQDIGSKFVVSQALAFFEEKHREVEYRIYADDYLGERYIAGNNEKSRIKIDSETGSYNFGNKISVDGLITQIMSTCKGVMYDGLGIGTEDGEKYVYKIVTTLNSSIEKYVIEYHIKRYKVIQTPYELALKGEKIKPLPGQSIEFDYIFTGKNTDIKSFDIVMEMGMAFYQMAATTDTVPNGRSSSTGLNNYFSTPGSSLSVAADRAESRPLTPLFLGSKVTQQTSRNKSEQSYSASFQSVMNKQAALESLGATLTIYGNPLLLDEMQIVPNNVGQNASSVGDISGGKVDINPNWLTVPTLIKVNVKMPVDVNNPRSGYKDFWYTGYYTLFSVKHEFRDGAFTQKLDLLSIPVADPFTGVDKDETFIGRVERFAASARQQLGIVTPQASNGSNKSIDKLSVKDVRSKHRSRRGARSGRN